MVGGVTDQIGLEWIDFDHFHLRAQFERLKAAADDGQWKDCYEILVLIRRQFARHADDEACFMEKIKYDNAIKHNEFHAIFIDAMNKRISDCKQDCGKKRRDCISVVGDLLNKEISGADADLKRFMDENNLKV